MTEEKIINALKLHASEKSKCLDCPYYHEQACSYDMAIDALDLINRQNAEIERLQHNNTRREANFLYLQKTLAEKNAKIKALQMDNAQIQSDNINANMNHEHLQAEIESLDFLIKESNKIAERQDKEIERLQAHNSSMQSTLAKMSMGVEQAKAEAIKEFAESFKVKFAKERYRDNYVIDDEMLDNLVKEMVGDTE